MNSLFDEVKIGNLTLKNRLVMPPMGFQTTGSDFSVSQRQEDYYVERAKGGFGLIYPGCYLVSDQYETVSGVNVLINQHQSVHLSTMIEKIHHYGAKVCIQLSLGMGRVLAVDPHTPPASSSAIPALRFPGLMCRPLEIEEIHNLVASCGYSAKLAMMAGADAVELHAYGGYLIDQFLCPLWNKRTDEYGGSIENRMRILFELRDAIRASCGEQFPIFVKFTPDHCFPGARTFENEGLEMMRILDEAGFAVIHLDYGSHDNRENKTPCVYSPEGLQLSVARYMREQGIKTPFMVQGKLDRPETAEETAQEGIAELIALGHGSIADPHWPKKVKSGHKEDVIPCIGCNECLNHLGRARRCAANPLSGYEKDYPLTPGLKGEKVIVVGAGPGGCIAALTAAKRGYDVELWEKNSWIGGALKAAASPEFKKSMRRYIAFLEAQLQKSSVKVCLSKTASAENLLEANPYGVIVASGAEPIVPPIPGLDGKHVYEACDILVKGGVEGDRIVIIGGGLVGCETALMLEQQHKKVIVVEKMAKLLAVSNHAAANNETLTRMLNDSSIIPCVGASVEALEEGKVHVRKGNEELEYECDAVILAVGYRPNHELEEALKGRIPHVVVIGDHVKSGKVLDATHQGFHGARLLEELD